MNKLEIKKVNPDPNEKPIKRRELHPNLPKPPQLWLEISPIKSGKSTRLMSYIYSSEFYRDYFDSIYYISPTVWNDKTVWAVREDEEIEKFEEYTDELIEAIVKTQQDFKNQDIQNLIAIILDDQLGQISLKRGSQVTKLASRFRHYDIGLLLISVQKFRGALDPIIRQNATTVVIGSPMQNEMEIKKIAEEYGDMFGGEKNFIQLYHENTPNRYDFIVLRLDENPAELWKGFEEKVYPKTDLKTED